MPEVGRGEVLILPDLSRFGRELDRGIGTHIDRAGRSMESTFATSAKRSAESVDKAFAKTASGLDIPIHADTDGLAAELRREVTPLVDRADADVPVGADTGGFGADLHRGIDPHLRGVDVPVEPDTAPFRRLPAEIAPHVRKAGDEMERSFAKSASGATKAIVGTIGVGVVAGIGRELLELGNQTAVFRQKTKTVFEDSTEDVQRWSKDNAKALGLTEARLAGVAANFGDLLKPMGFTSAEAAKMSTNVVGLAGALSAWSGGTRSVIDVSETLSKAMLGEREELKGLGISITEADVKTRLLAKGQADLTGTALQQAEALATQELIFEKSTDAQKAWADGSFDAIKTQNELRAKVGEITESLAEGLLPVFTAAAEVLERIPTPAIAATGALVGIGAAAVGINKAVGAIKELPNPLERTSLGAAGARTALLRMAGVVGGIFAVKAALDAVGVGASDLGLDLEKVIKLADKDLVRGFRELRDVGLDVQGFNEILGQSPSQAQRLIDALGAAGIETGKYRKLLDESIATHKAVAKAKDEDAKITGDLGEKVGELGPHTRGAREEMERFAGILRDAHGASMSLIGSQKGVADAVDALRDSAAETAGKERDLAAAIRTHGAASAEAKVAGEALEDARRRQLGDVDALAQANVRLAEIQATAAGKTLSDADKYRLYRDELIKVKDTLAPDAPLRKHLQGLIDAMPPPVVKSQVVLDTAKWEAQLRSLQKAFPNVSLPFGNKLHDGGLVGGRADEVPAILQRGEFVVQRAAVEKVGLPALEELNRFHDGGLVPKAVMPSFATLGPAPAALPAGTLDRVAGMADAVTGSTSGGVTINGGVNITGVRDADEAASLIPLRLRSEMFLAGY